MEKPTEYAALDFDGTERRANYRTVAYRIDILHLCERKDAAAILYEIIYRWQTEVRKPEITKEIERRKKANLPPMTEDEVDSLMWVWMSYNDFVRESGGAVGYNTVIRMLDYLVEDVKIVECRENHDPRYPDYEYRVRLDIVKEKLKALPATPAFLPKVPKKKSNKGGESTQMGTAEKRSTQKGRRAQRSTQVGTDSTQMGTATTQEGRGVYPDGGTSHTTTHTSHIEHTEGTYRASGSQGQECAVAQPAPTVPYRPDFNADQSRIATDTEDTSHGTQPDSANHSHSGVGTGLRTDHSGLDQEAPPTQAVPGTAQGHARAASQQTTTAVTPAGGSGYKQDQKPDGGKRGGRKASEEKAPEPVFTEGGRKVNDAWASLFKSPPSVGPKTIECANALHAQLMPWCRELRMQCRDLLSEIKDWEYATDPDYYRKRGVALCDIHRDFERWQSVKTEALEQEKRRAANPTASPLFDTSAIEQMRANRLRYAGGMQA